jgi:class 3 adenylate cyclase
METAAQINRTWLCSVIFMDIAGYSTRPLCQQIREKQDFERILASALASVPEKDRFMIDAGDGAALCFLGDPEDVLFAAFALREAFPPPTEDADTFGVRIGVNIGPVKLMRDCNGDVKPIGEGLNVAQRIMSFGTAEEVLVSRSFYEMVACLSAEYEAMFQYEGTRKDKHIREHTVYRLLPRHGFTRRDPNAPSPPRHPALPPELIQRIEMELSVALGPVARVLVNRAAACACDPGELIRRIAEELPDTSARNAFITKYGEKIGSLCALPEIPAGAGPEEEEAVVNNPDTAFLEQLLAEYVGPVARVLLKRAASRAANTAELITLLKTELAGPAEQAAFSKRAEKHLKAEKASPA